MPDKDLFATLSFKGERFNGKFIPVEALPAIASYQETLIELAKAIWRDENPDRERLPKNFQKYFALGLEGIGDGSKVAKLPRQFAETDDLFGDVQYEDVFLEAQDRLAATVLAVNKNEKIQPLPENVLAPFERFSKTIRPSEYIDVDPLGHGKKRYAEFRISENSATKIIELSRFRKTKKVDDIGFVVGISESPPSLKISSAAGSFSYPMQWSDLRAGDHIQIGTVVSFSVTAETDAAGAIRKFVSAGGISRTVESRELSRIRGRLSEIGSLQSGWHDGVGAPPTDSTLIRSGDMATFLARKYGDAKAYPDLDGGIQFEWVSSEISVSLLVEGDTFLLGASDLQSEKFREKLFKGISYGFLRELTNLDGFVGR